MKGPPPAGRPSDDVAWEQSRERWRNVSPDTGLTWGLALDGSGFLQKVFQYAPITRDTRVLEVGPGYGRFLAALGAAGIAPARYLGVDISEQNVRFLKEKFPLPGVSFVHGDAERVAVEGPFDLFVCTVTIHHFYPDFKALLANLRPALAPGAKLIFDLHEGTKKYFEADGVTYIACYTREEIKRLLAAAGYRDVAFDQVKHDEAHRRLLVVAERPR